jgi:hypothetical protein
MIEDEHFYHPEEPAYEAVILQSFAPFSTFLGPATVTVE